MFTTPQWSDSGGWDDPSAYQTIQLANVDGEPGDELIGRSSVGIWVEKFVNGQWRMLGTADGGVALQLSDDLGWNGPDKYVTIQAGDVNGDGAQELLARAGDGLHVYRWDAPSATFVDIAKPPLIFSDAGGWRAKSQYSTIQTADIYGHDGRVEVIGRAADGVHIAVWNEEASRFDDPGPFSGGDGASNADGGDRPENYEVLQTGDLDGDGAPELLIRRSIPVQDIQVFKWYPDSGYPNGGFWSRRGGFRVEPSDGYNRPSQYQTIQTADVDGNGRADILARTADGLHAYRWEEHSWPQPAPVLGALSDANGFTEPSLYRTIQTGDVDGNGTSEVIAKTQTGITVWTIRDGQWVQLSTGTPALTGDTWSQPQHFETLQTGDPDGDQSADLLTRGVFGIRTFAWRDGTFGRPSGYGYPAFGAADVPAYAALGQFLLGRPADFRLQTYASPSEAITEATLDRYRGLLAERCDPVAVADDTLDPPQYANCRPPAGSGIEGGPWTAVTNQIIAELWSAAGVVAHFTTLDTIQTKLFQDQQGTFPALNAELTLPANPPDRAATYLKLTKSALEIVGDIFQFFPVAKEFPRVVRSIALTAHSLGAIGDGLGLSSTPSQPDTYAKITGEIAKIQQRERDLTQAQRRYVMADYGLLSTVGSLVNARLWTLDDGAALSAGRQAFATWVYQLYLPVYWARYQVNRCFYNGTWHYCTPPTGSFIRVTTPPRDRYVNFVAMLVGGSGCTKGFANVTCTWRSPAGATYDRLVTPTAQDCIYNPTPGSTAAWRYGCSLGLNPNDLINGTNGWEPMPVISCDGYDGNCKQIAAYDTVTANDDAYTGVVGRPTVISRPGVLFNDGGPAATTHRATLLTQPTSGVLRFKPNGSFVYTPSAAGTVTFTYRVTDTSGASDDATVTITSREGPRR